MHLNKQIYEEITKDIQRCRDCNSVPDSQELFETILYKYGILNPKFGEGLPNSGKASTIGGSYNYVREVHVLAEQLRMIQLEYVPPNETLSSMLEEDIQECFLFLGNTNTVDDAKTLYERLTARYDSLIVDLGKGMYSYIPDLHFYDPDVSLDALLHNLRIIYQRLIVYRTSIVSNVEKKIEPIKEKSKRVFVVHGHDYSTLKLVTDFLQNIGLEPIVLKDKPSKSNTIIDKFERYSDVSYAVILYTPCDVGKNKKRGTGQLKSRARQNVVFEHGYLIAKLMRENTCALIKDDVEKPSDISGMIYIAFDKFNNWQSELKKELVEAKML
jgi:predicted nucleotide-binding protein